MIESEPYVLSWLVLVLEGERTAASVMYEGLWEKLIIKSDPNILQ